MELANVLIQGGIGAASLAVMLYMSRGFMAMLRDKDADYKAFVEARNHQTTEILNRSIEVNTKAVASIDANTKVMERVVDRLNQK